MSGIECSSGTLEGPFSLVIAFESLYATRNPQPPHPASWRSRAELGGEAHDQGTSVTWIGHDGGGFMSVIALLYSN